MTTERFMASSRSIEIGDVIGRWFSEVSHISNVEEPFERRGPEMNCIRIIVFFQRSHQDNYQATVIITLTKL
uniref:Uncharacterized protein n=1 Tax=Oryza brachyantha TaxID=4533 RepID=J3N4J7_ORYBR